MDDAVAVLDGLGIPAAHVVGLSMGGFAALHLTIRHPDRVLSSVAAGTGYGAAPTARPRSGRVRGDRGGVRERGVGAGRAVVRGRAGPVQFQNKNPRAGPSSRTRWPGTALGSALTMRGVQAGRPSLYALRDELARITTPLLVLAGDEDEAAWMWRSC